MKLLKLGPKKVPTIGADLSKRVSFKTDYKYVVWKDYVILYKIGKETVEIYRVVNHYQDITKIFGKKLVRHILSTR